jgi:hypothetical protein
LTSRHCITPPRRDVGPASTAWASPERCSAFRGAECRRHPIDQSPRPSLLNRTPGGKTSADRSADPHPPGSRHLRSSTATAAASPWRLSSPQPPGTGSLAEVSRNPIPAAMISLLFCAVLRDRARLEESSQESASRSALIGLSFTDHPATATLAPARASGNQSRVGPTRSASCGWPRVSPGRRGRALRLPESPGRQASR